MICTGTGDGSVRVSSGSAEVTAEIQRAIASAKAQAGNRKGIEELKHAIARVAATLPEVGRSVPKSFVDIRQALGVTGVPYLSLDAVIAICRLQSIDDDVARLFITISHRLGHLTHYENDPALRPDWLASAMSYVLDRWRDSRQPGPCEILMPESFMG